MTISRYSLSKTIDTCSVVDVICNSRGKILHSTIQQRDRLANRWLSSHEFFFSVFLVSTGEGVAVTTTTGIGNSHNVTTEVKGLGSTTVVTDGSPFKTISLYHLRCRIYNIVKLKLLTVSFDHYRSRSTFIPQNVKNHDFL